MAMPRRRRWWIPAVIAAGLLMALGIVGWRLRQRDYFWKNPLAGAHFTRLTDWEGSELDAAIRRMESSSSFSPTETDPMTPLCFKSAAVSF